MTFGLSSCRNFFEICLVLVLAWIPLGYALPTAYGGARVTGGGTTYIGTQANGQDVFLGTGSSYMATYLCLTQLMDT